MFKLIKNKIDLTSSKNHGAQVVNSVNEKTKKIDEKKKINEFIPKEIIIKKEFDKFEEVKRIYESGGELRELAGEDKARIFVKGKYYPALITTRSLGDEIASQIGVKSNPHISTYKLEDRINYYLLLCTDGIFNAVKIEDIVSIIENNDFCIFIFLN